MPCIGALVGAACLDHAELLKNCRQLRLECMLGALCQMFTCVPNACWRLQCAIASPGVLSIWYLRAGWCMPGSSALPGHACYAPPVLHIHNPYLI